jgi:hypothetical protein
MTASQAKRVRLLSDRFWRLNNLYWIIDEQGNPVKFVMNPVQERLYRRMWYLNVIPKSRQHGITSFIAIFILDACLFNSNTRAGIIAHRLQDAKKILRDKILYAYHRLPDDLKAARPLKTESTEEIVIKHNETDTSTIWVATSMRSGTLQILHISEYGKLCARMPVKAHEVKTGAMPTIHKGGFIFVESTAEGPFGDFYDMCIEAQANEGRDMTRLDWRCHFFGWMDKLSNVVDGQVEIPENVNEYLDKIETVYDRTFTINQRSWYALTKKRYKHDMFKEHPSTMDECFMASVEGAYYGMEVAQMREEGRICPVAHQSRELVHTICDLGVGSHMPWLFFQMCGKEIHIINEFNLDKDDAAGGAVFYREMLDTYRNRYHYQYGRHFSPHDVSKKEIGSGQTIFKTFAEGGVHFTKLPLEKTKHEGIERTRHLFDVLWIDSKCTGVIMGVSAYHREWVESLGTYQEKPKNDGAAHWADAVRYLSLIDKKGLCKARENLTLAKVKQWGRKWSRTG